jgi:hypothetical protein
MKRWAWAALLLAACGPGAGIYLTVQAPLVVPTQCDAVHIVATRSVDDAGLYDQVSPLDASKQFPVTLTLEAGSTADEDPAGIDVEADALLAGTAAAPWASGTGHVVLTHRVLTPLTITFCNSAADAGCGP